MGNEIRKLTKIASPQTGASDRLTGGKRRTNEGIRAHSNPANDNDAQRPLNRRLTCTGETEPN